MNPASLMKKCSIKYKVIFMVAVLIAISSHKSIALCLSFKSNPIPSSTLHFLSDSPRTQSKMKPTPYSLLTLTALLLSALSPATSCKVQTNWKITFFGYPDNSPAGGDIAFDCGRGFTAGGDGSLGNPVTMAAAYNAFAKCEVIYIPYLKKYARYEDYCGQCGMLSPFTHPHSLLLPLVKRLIDVHFLRQGPEIGPYTYRHLDRLDKSQRRKNTRAMRRNTDSDE